MKPIRSRRVRSSSGIAARWGAALASCAVVAALVGSAVLQQTPRISDVERLASVGEVYLSAEAAPLPMSADPGGGPGGGEKDPGDQVSGGPARAQPDSGGNGNSGKDSSPTTPVVNSPEKPKPATDNGSSTEKKETGVSPQPTNEPASGSVPQRPGESTKAAPPPLPGDSTTAAVPQKPGTVSQNGPQPSVAPGVPPVPDTTPQGEGAQGCVAGTPGCAPKPAPPAQDGGGCADPTKGCNSGVAPDDGFGWDDAGHVVLDVISLVPGANIPASAIQTSWYEGEGNHVEAGIAAVGMIPGGKWVTSAGKLIGKGYTAVKDLFKGEKALEEGVQAAKHLPEGQVAAGAVEGPTPPGGPGKRPDGQPETNDAGGHPPDKRPAPGTVTRGTIDEAAKPFSPEERRVADRLAEQGRSTKSIKESPEDGVRTPDAEVDGKPTEFKSIDPSTAVADASKLIKSTVENSARNRGQARQIIVDARGNAGITREGSESAISRVLGGRRADSFDRIEVWGKDGWDVVWTRP